MTRLCTLASTPQSTGATPILHTIRCLSSHSQGVWLQSRYVGALQRARMGIVSSAVAMAEVIVIRTTTITAACLASAWVFAVPSVVD